MRKIALAATVLLTTVTLAGCAATENYACDPFVTGAQADSIKVSKDMTAMPEVDFASPLSAPETQTQIVVEGQGPKFLGDMLLDIEYSGYNGGTGQLVQSSGFDGSNVANSFFTAGMSPDFCHAIAGAREGSRVVTVIPPELAHGSQGIAELGLGPNDSLIFVFDLIKVYPVKASGSKQLPVAGFPDVVTTPEGVPGVTIPKTDPPTKLMITETVKGDGPIVELGELATLHYSGFLWSDGTKFDSSWDNGKPVQFPLVEGGLIEGFLSAVVGKTVGSQVIAVIPPELGYGDADAGSIPGGSTLIFVIDILATAPNTN